MLESEPPMLLWSFGEASWTRLWVAKACYKLYVSHSISYPSFNLFHRTITRQNWQLNSKLFLGPNAWGDEVFAISVKNTLQHSLQKLSGNKVVSITPNPKSYWVSPWRWLLRYCTVMFEMLSSLRHNETCFVEGNRRSVQRRRLKCARAARSFFFFQESPSQVEQVLGPLHPFGLSSTTFLKIKIINSRLIH